MSKKILFPPKPIVIPEGRQNMQTGETTDLEYPMRRWLTVFLDNYAPFGKGPKNIRIAQRIFNAYNETKRNYFILEEEEYNMLKEAIAGPDAVPLIPRIARHTDPYIRLVENAEEVDLNKEGQAVNKKTAKKKR